MTIGLTLGKFAPMHIGHESLIHEALEIVDRLYVLLYDCPDKTSVPLSVRASWVKACFPTERVVVIEGYDAPNRHEDTPEVRHIQELYLCNKFKDIQLTHFLSSEYYGEHVSQALNVKNIVLDPERKKHGVVATDIRAELWEKRKTLSPNVYRDLLYKVAILGDGKTDIKWANELAIYFDTIAFTTQDIHLERLRPYVNEAFVPFSEFDNNSEKIYDAKKFLFISSSYLNNKGQVLAKTLKEFDRIYVIDKATAVNDEYSEKTQKVGSIQDIVDDLKRQRSDKIF